MVSTLDENTPYLSKTHDENIKNIWEPVSPKTTEIENVKHVLSEAVAETLKKWASRYGPPEFAACIAAEIEAHALH